MKPRFVQTIGAVKLLAKLRGDDSYCFSLRYFVVWFNARP